MARSAQRVTRGAPTLATVAAEAGVSRQTVSNAVNNPELLRPETLERVQQAISALGYSPNRAARNLRTRTSRLIGLRVDRAREDAANALMDRFLHSLVEHSRDAGYHVLLFTGQDESQPAGARQPELTAYDDLLRSTAVDAFVVTDTYRGNPQAVLLQERGAPFVAFGRPWQSAGDPPPTHPWVDVDGAAGVALAVEHLVARGHQRIGWIGWSADSFIGEDRREGWLTAADRHGLQVRGLDVRAEDSVDAGRRAATALLDSRVPTAIACASDTLAMGVLHALADRGLRPGGDVAVVGFDDSLAAAVAPPGLTSVRQPLEEVAREVVAALGRLLSHKPVDEPGRILTPTLTVRASS